MADDLIQYSKGDLVYKGTPMLDAMSGTVSIANGAQLVKTLRKGVAGFFTGTREGTLNWKQAIVKAGMKEDFMRIIFSGKPVVTVSFMVADDLILNITGIMNGSQMSFSEAGMVEGDFNVHGRLSKSDL